MKTIIHNIFKSNKRKYDNYIEIHNKINHYNVIQNLRKEF